MAIETTKHPGRTRQIGPIGRTPWQAARRVGDADATPRRGLVYRRERGLSVIELLVAMGVFAVIVGTAIPRTQPGRYAAWNAQLQLLADFRQTRADALVKGDHFRLDVLTATTYVETRLRFVGGVWTPDVAPVRTRTLPNGVAFTSAIGRRYEFNTRGLLINPGAAETIDMHCSTTNQDRSITVWPSGQVNG